jgi:hypothetical protein
VGGKLGFTVPVFMSTQIFPIILQILTAFCFAISQTILHFLAFKTFKKADLPTRVVPVLQTLDFLLGDIMYHPSWGFFFAAK